MKGRRPCVPDPFDGILLVDKPAGWTSHDVVAKIRGHFRLNKVGHAGTLDPQATGLLILLIGKGTKLSGRIMAGDKTYEGTLKLGVTTCTQDADGEILEQTDASCITRKQVEEVVQNHFTGDIQQIPPMVSAIKKGGVSLYKLARKGQEIEREPRSIHVFSFDITGFENPFTHFRVKSTKGTYVRTLAHDIGSMLGVGARLEALRRTNSSPFSLEGAYTLEQILACERWALAEKIVPIP